MQLFKIVEQSDRYTWVVNPATAEPIGFGFSPISFATEEAAAADFKIYRNSKRDGNGRTIRTREQLAALIRIAAEICPECNGVAFIAPQWQKADASGCNWYVDANGDDLSVCSDCIAGAIVALQAAYNIPDAS